MEQTETILINQLKAGDEKAYQYIYEHHYAVLCHVAEGYVKDRFVAETIVGDLIFHIWEIRERLEIGVSLRSYLMRAVRNRCTNYLMSEHERREIAFSALSDEVKADESRVLSDRHPLGLLLERELEDEIYKAVEDLPNECRNVFVRSRFYGKSYEEISQELGISVNTVKYHIKRALSSLHKRLGKYLISLFLLFFTLN